MKQTTVCLVMAGSLCICMPGPGLCEEASSNTAAPSHKPLIRSKVVIGGKGNVFARDNPNSTVDLNYSSKTTQKLLLCGAVWHTALFGNWYEARRAARQGKSREAAQCYNNAADAADAASGGNILMTILSEHAEFLRNRHDYEEAAKIESKLKDGAAEFLQELEQKNWQGMADSDRAVHYRNLAVCQEVLGDQSAAAVSFETAMKLNLDDGTRAWLMSEFTNYKTRQQQSKGLCN